MADLFQDQVESPISMNLPDADLRFFCNALTSIDASKYFADLHQSIPWCEEEIVVWGKRYKQPRLIAWFGDSGAQYTYSGSMLTPRPWTPTLQSLRQIAERLSGAHFNSVLLNLYRDHSDRMGWHSDDEPALGPRPVIASFSLGAKRTFQMKHKKRPELGTKSFELTSGSLFVMAGSTQQFWMHSVRKESKPTGARINLTFRTII